jgi:serine/threonine protein kinase
MEDYDIIKPLGKGSFGDVNLAKEKKTGRLVAIKDLHIPQILKLNKKDAVVREGKILEKLHGKPFIIELIVKFKEGNQLFFVF